MRVLIISLNYAPELTGIGKYSGEMAAWLAKRGHEVHVLAGPPHYPQWNLAQGYGGFRYQSESRDGVHVQRAPLYLRNTGEVSTKDRLLLESSFNLSSVLPWLRYCVVDSRYDVVVSVVPPLQTALLPVFYATLKGVPLVIHVQDLQVDAAMGLGFFRRSKWFSKALLRIERSLLLRATRVTTVSTRMREKLIAKGVEEHRTSVIENWADTDFIRPLPRDTTIRAMYGVRPDEIFVLYAGNIGQKQGLETLLEAAGLLAPNRGIRFGIFGEGTSKRRLVAMSRDLGLTNVAFHDLVEWAEFPRLLSAADIHVVVQRESAADLVMPSKVGNALASGRALVATCSSGTALHRVIEESEAGLAVKPESPQELASAIQDLARNSSLRDAMGTNARSYAESFLARDSILGRFEVLLESLADFG